MKSEWVFTTLEAEKSYRTESFGMQMNNVNEVRKQHLLKMNVDINKVKDIGKNGKSNQSNQLLEIIYIKKCKYVVSKL